MPALTIVLDAEERGFSSIERLKQRLGIPKHPDGDQMAVLNEHLHHLADDAEIQIGGLVGGMSSGAPSVAMCFTLPSGEVVLAETSMALFLTAADALKAKLGDPRRWSLTDAQYDALERLKRKHRGLEKRGLDQLGRQVVLLPGEEPERRRLRAITKSGIVERVAS